MSENPVRKDGVMARKLGDECLLYDPATGALHVLNASGHMVWEMCDGAHTPEDMEAAMRDLYEVGQDADVRRDVEQVLTSLRDKDLLKCPAP
jgi:PqqD family protein of HPr-rel-A system